MEHSKKETLLVKHNFKNKCDIWVSGCPSTGVQAASEMKPISVSDSQEVSYSGHWLLEALTAMVEVH